MSVMEGPARAGRPAPARRPAPAARPPLTVVGPGERLPARHRRSAAKSRRANTILVLLGLAVTSIVVFGLVLINIALAQSSFQLGDVQRQVNEQQTEQRRLRYEIAKAESPENVAQMSVQLGLVPPERQQYLQGPSVLVSNTDRAGAGQAGYELSAARRP